MWSREWTEHIPDCFEKQLEVFQALLVEFRPDLGISGLLCTRLQLILRLTTL